MPSILTLQGPKLGPAQAVRSAPTVRFVGAMPEARIVGINGLGDFNALVNVFLAHPWVIVGGLFLGGYLASNHAQFGSVWGSHQAAHSRTRALHGHRRRSRR